MLPLRILLTTLAAGLAIILFPHSATAQSGAGFLSGRVTDHAASLPLAGARVSIPGTGEETFTSRYGEYTFPGVPAGTQTVVFSYVGYEDISRSVNVAAGAAARLDVAFGDDDRAVELAAMEIKGSVVGTARAINLQRAADTLTNVVASDEIGNFPDQNAAESIQRIPGVSLYRDQGEGRYVVLRGLNYTFTSVKVNGGSFAGADMGERATALDVIPPDALAAVEVTKVPTPDMDGEGLGGQVDIKTKSPFEFDGLAASVTAQGQFADQSGKYSSKFNGYVSQRFGADGKFGLLVAPTWQSRKFGSQNVETGGAWVSPEDNGTDFYTMESVEFRDYVIERERYGLSVSLETKPDETSLLYVRGGYNRFTDTESRHLTIFDFTEGRLDTTSVTADSATFTGLRRYGRRLRIREKDQEVSVVTVGGEKRAGNWAFDAQAGYTEGDERRPNEVTARFRRNTRDATIRYKTDGPYRVSIEQLAGASFYDPASYNLQRVDYSNEHGSERESFAGANARYEFEESATYVKFGGLFRGKNKDSEGEAYEFDSAPADFTFANLAEPPSRYPFLRVPRISTALARNAFLGNRDGFAGERLFEDSEYEDFAVSEDVAGGYVMVGTSLGKLNVIGGVRLEHTSFATTGRELDLDAETATTVHSSRSYTNTLPGIYLRYDASEKLVLRASWSNALARPSFGDAAFRSLINREDLEITRGNPNLDALEATNWDLSAEYYLSSLGVVSAAVFHKEIENFSYEYESPDPVIIDGESYYLTTYANGSDGSITGLELAYQQQLRMLPAPFDGLGIMANVTFLDSDASYPTRPGEKIPFTGQSDTTGNVALTYEKGGWFVRLAMNFRSERLREDEPLGGNAAQDLYVDSFTQLDLSTRYRISEQWEVFADVLNLTDEPFRVFLKSDNGQGTRLGQWEEYGWSANFGVRWRM